MQRVIKSIILHSFIPMDHPIYESYIEGKMIERPINAKRYRVEEYLKLVYIDLYELLIFMDRKGMSTSSPLQMITLGLDIFT